MSRKPGIVFAHGLWADGSCFNKVMGPLRAEGYEVIASEHGLDSLQGDVDCVIRAVGRVCSPVILVGHSYGGTLITAAGTDDRVAGLVYICALAPDETETSQSQQEKSAAPTSCSTWSARPPMPLRNLWRRRSARVITVSPAGQGRASSRPFRRSSSQPGVAANRAPAWRGRCG